MIPISIGTTKYSAKFFAIINLISALIWASITIILAYIFGEEILKILHFAKDNFLLVLPIAVIMVIGIGYYFHIKTVK